MRVWQRNQPKYNTKPFHNYKENIWLKNMQLIESNRCFVPFRNEESEFWILLSLPLLTGLWLERFLRVSHIFIILTTLSTFLLGTNRNTRRKRTTFGRALTSVTLNSPKVKDTFANRKTQFYWPVFLFFRQINAQMGN